MPDLNAVLMGLNNGSSLNQSRYDSEGQNILDLLHKYDPNASWNVDHGNGEGDSAARYTINFDGTKLPKADMGQAWTHIRAMDKGNDNLIDPNAVWQDSNYGSVTDSRNIKKQKAEWWESVAPLAVSMLAPMAGSALFAAGIGGGTSAITGAAAGLGAGNIASGGQASWLSNLARKAPDIARRADSFDWSQFTKPQQQQPSMADILRAYGQRNYSQGGN